MFEDNFNSTIPWQNVFTPMSYVAPPIQRSDLQVQGKVQGIPLPRKAPKVTTEFPNFSHPNNIMRNINRGWGAFNASMNPYGKGKFLNMARAFPGNNGKMGTIAESIDMTGNALQTIDNLVNKKRYNQDLSKQMGIYAYGGRLFGDGGNTEGGNTNKGETLGNAINAVGTSASLIGNAIENAQTKDTSQVKGDLINRMSPAQGISDNFDDAMNDWSKMPTFGTLHGRDLTNNSPLGGIANAIQAGAQGMQAGSQFGPIGAAVGAGLGVVTSGIGSIFGKIKANREAHRVNRLARYVEDYNVENLTNRFENLRTDQLSNNMRNFAAFGGSLNTYAEGGNLHTNGADWDTGIMDVNSGGTHEENPYDGVQVSADEQGTPNLVEEGEVIYNDYVYSNRMEVPEEVLSAIGIKGRKKGMTFADAAKKVEKDLNERPNDPITKRGVEASMQILAEAQEEERQMQQQQEQMMQQYMQQMQGMQGMPDEQMLQEQMMQEQMAQQQMQEAQMQDPYAQGMQEAPVDYAAQYGGVEGAPGYAYGGSLTYDDYNTYDNYDANMYRWGSLIKTGSKIGRGLSKIFKVGKATKRASNINKIRAARITQEAASVKKAAAQREAMKQTFEGRRELRNQILHDPNLSYEEKQIQMAELVNIDKANKYPVVQLRHKKTAEAGKAIAENADKKANRLSGWGKFGLGVGVVSSAVGSYLGNRPDRVSSDDIINDRKVDSLNTRKRQFKDAGIYYPDTISADVTPTEVNTKAEGGPIGRKYPGPGEYPNYLNFGQEPILRMRKAPSFGPTWSYAPGWQTEGMFNQYSYPEANLTGNIPYSREPQEKDARFDDFTNYVLENRTNPSPKVLSYLRDLDKHAPKKGGEGLLFDAEGNLKSDWDKTYEEQRTTGPWGYYHITPKYREELNIPRRINWSDPIERQAALNNINSWKDLLPSDLKENKGVDDEESVNDEEYNSTKPIISSPNKVIENLKYAPIFADAIGLGMSLKHYYNNVNDANRAIYNGFRPIAPEIPADYLPYTPVDVMRQANVLASQSAGISRALANASNGNLGQVGAQILAGDRNAQVSMADALAKADELNFERRKAKKDFDRATNNNRASIKNAAEQFNANLRQTMAQALVRNAMWKDEIDATRRSNIIGNISNMATNLNNMRTDAINRSERDALIRAGVFGTPSFVPYGWTVEDYERWFGHGKDGKSKGRKGGK